jgi:hypothetical protein
MSIPGTANDKTVHIMDVSLGGLTFRTDRIAFAIGDEVLMELDVPHLGDVAIGANIVRIVDANEYGVAYTGLSSDAFKLLEALEIGRHRRPMLKVA